MSTNETERTIIKPAVVSEVSEAQVEVVREFEAPVEQVWKPFTEAGLVCQWMLGPPGWMMPVCEMDFRIGGEYQNVFRNDVDGSEIKMSGTLMIGFSSFLKIDLLYRLDYLFLERYWGWMMVKKVLCK